MALNINKASRTVLQPQVSPQINWTNPISRNLRGFLWVGPGKTYDLVNPQIPWKTNGTLVPTTAGIARVTSSSQAGATTGYGTGISQDTISPWKLSTKPLSLFCFCERYPGTVGSGSALAGVTSGGTGYILSNVYGTNRRMVCYSAAGIYGDLGYLNNTSTWLSGTQVRGFTHNGQTMTGYDGGRLWASVSDATSSVYFDPYTAVGHMADPYAGDTGGAGSMASGAGYWMALWSRVLTPNEVLSLQLNPWQLVAPATSRPILPLASSLVVYRPWSDIAVAGWIGNPDNTNKYANINETSESDAEYIQSPDILASPDIALALNAGLLPGAYDVSIRGKYIGNASKLRVVMYDELDGPIAYSSWQPLSTSFTTYTLNVDFSSSSASCAYIKIEVSA